ncbi:choline dehydrogenase [Pseudonocardia xinjiangensis]|uniref:choline dehydrogenase n=1 Tax=Pseudonocardia xinjiangensis TaxID=75289 RepID=UPI003D93033A
MVQKPFDVVIVGGGTAGCVLANRLTADGNTRVLLLEAGRPDYWWDLPIQLPIAMGMPVGDKHHDWLYESEPEPGLQNRRLHHPRGKGIGGSSAINGMMYQRGHPTDFDRWGVESGTPEWDYAHCLPYFRRLENCLSDVDESVRGRGGPHTLQRGPAEGPIFEAFLSAAEQAGHKLLPDLNGTEQEGFAPLDQGVRRGRRESAARSYLGPARKRPNLEVRSRTMVTRLHVEGGRVVGVRYRQGTGGDTVVPAREVILCAGAIGSPQLLQLSGIGAARELEALGVRVVHDLPGVGESLQDHLAVHLQHLCREPVSMAPIRRKVHWPRVVAEALLFGRGPGSRNPMQAGGFARSGPEESHPDLMYLLAPLAMNSTEQSVPLDEHGYQLHVGVMRSQARGSVKITSRDPARHPAILLNFLTEPEDRRRWVEAVRMGRELLAQPALQHLDGGERIPGPEVRSDDEVLDWVTRTAKVGLHLACSARMGTDDGAVVDPSTLRVRGLDGLRIVDAAVMPSLTNANTYGPVMMLAEKAADMILGNTALAPEYPGTAPGRLTVAGPDAVRRPAGTGRAPA